MFYGYEFEIGKLVTWLADLELDERHVGVIVSLEDRGDDESKIAGAWVSWAESSTGWSPLDCLIPIEDVNSLEE